MYFQARKVVIPRVITEMAKAPITLTKILGEVIDDNNLTLRTSIVGPEIEVNGEVIPLVYESRGKIQGFTLFGRE